MNYYNQSLTKLFQTILKTLHNVGFCVIVMTMNHIPKKSLGQNFLKSESALMKIIDAGDITANDIILEIGPGMGALTEKLLAFGGKVIAVEKDDSLSEFLHEKFPEEISRGRLDIINADILEFDEKLLKNYTNPEVECYKLIANIPYNITGAIIRKFTESEFQPKLMVLLVQKEVAERITTKNKDKNSLLSICIAVYGTATYIKTVPAGSFHPAPKVDSAIIKIDSISRKNFINMEHENIFFTLVKSGFAHPRKVVISNIGQVFDKTTIEHFFVQLGIKNTLRAEDVLLSDWINLSKLVYTDIYESNSE